MEPQDCGAGWSNRFRRIVWGLHKIVEGHQLKNNSGDSHSHKKRAAPVDAWPVANPSSGGHHIKKRGMLCFPKALRAGASAAKVPHAVDKLSCFDPRGPNPNPRWIPPLTKQKG